MQNMRQWLWSGYRIIQYSKSHNPELWAIEFEVSDEYFQNILMKDGRQSIAFTIMIYIY